MVNTQNSLHILKKSSFETNSSHINLVVRQGAIALHRLDHLLGEDQLGIAALHGDGKVERML